MTGRLLIFVLLLSVILQTNLFARGCFSYNNHVQPSGSSLNSCRNYSISLVVCSGFSSAVNTTSCAFCGVTPSNYCGSCGSQTGINNKSCHTGCVRCDDQCSADSVLCLLNGESFDSQTCTCVPDTTFKCTSVSTENNVIRSQIDYIIHDTDVVKQKYILGSCIQNNFCEAGGERQTYSPDNPTFAYDSCSYDSVSTSNCNFVGQNGSSCRYVCPDGRNWNCRMGWASGGVDLPQCPSKPWKECSDEYVARPVDTPADKLNPDTLANHVPDLGNSGAPYDNVLSALDDISDRIHQQTQIDFQRQYVDEQMYNMVGGYGAWEGDGIWQNTKRIDEDLNDVNANIAETNSGINSVVINQNTIIKHIENDTIKVEVHNDSTKPLWVMPNWEPLVFAVDTNVQKVENKLTEINSLVDTLVSDTPRTNKILSGIAPSIGQILDNLDTLIERIPTPSSIMSGISDSIANKLKPWLDYVVVDSAEYDSLRLDFENIMIPNPTLDSLSDSIEADSLFFDTSWVSANDSLVNFLDSILHERMKDTIPDTLPLDKLAGDSAQIRNKLNMVFLPDEVIEGCFEFHMSPVIRFSIGSKSYSYDLSMFIDFADLFGLDLCGLIRKIVEILTFIVIVFTTIKGYIRAFGGSNIGG